MNFLSLAGFGRPTFDISTRDAAMLANACWQILDQKGEAKEPFLFRHGDRLVRFVSSEEDGTARLEPLTADLLSYELAKRIYFEEARQRGTPAGRYPPPELVRHMLADPNPPVHHLQAITRVPVFSPYFELIQKVGYDPISGILFHPAKGIRSSFHVSSVTSEDVRKAKSLIVDELLGDFPFVSQADRANAVSLLILPFVQHLIPGFIPMYLIDKPRPGEGATLLASVLLTPGLGDAIPRTPPPSDEGEWRRTIFAHLNQGANVLLFDNLAILRSSYLASAITSEFVSDRQVGTGSARSVPVKCIWVGTSIAAELSDEMSRRTVFISLDSGVENPSERSKFAIPNLKQWATDNRDRLIGAALTIVQGWMDAAAPFSEKTLGTFELYAEIMGGILEYAEIPGFLDTSHRPARAGSVTQWLQGVAFTTNMYLQFVDESVPANQLVNIARQVRFISPTDDVHVLARKLSQIQDKTFGKFILRKAKVWHNTILWKAENTGSWESGD
jgi:putative DNA primase/helicase